MKIRTSIVTIIILILFLTSISNVISKEIKIGKIDVFKDEIIENSDDLSFNIGEMKIDGTKEDQCKVTINDAYDSDYSPYTIWSYEDEETLSISADWKVVTDIRTIYPPTTERWSFTLTINDEGENDIFETKTREVEDTYGDESGKEGTATIDFTIPRYAFHHSLVDCGKVSLEIRLYCVYEVWDNDDERWVEKDWAHSHGYIDVNPANEIPYIISKSASKYDVKFGEPVVFSVSAEDNDGDPVHFFFDWDGDGFNDYSQDDVVTKFADGPAVTITHTWDKKNYPDKKELTITPIVYVQDKIQGTSPGEPFNEIIVPKNRQFSKNYFFIQNLLEKFPALNKLIFQLF